MEDFPVTRCADGIASGAFDLATRGTGMKVTCWTNPKNQLPDLPWNHVRGVPLWPQEMAVLNRELMPEIRARMRADLIRGHWSKLWAALEEIPEDQAIEDYPPKRRSSSAKSRTSEPVEESEFRSPFCNHGECGRCKQIDCECQCHQQVR